MTSSLWQVNITMIRILPATRINHHCRKVMSRVNRWDDHYDKVKSQLEDDVLEFRACEASIGRNNTVDICG